MQQNEKMSLLRYFLKTKLYHFNHCGCHPHLELFLFGLKAQSTTPFCTGNVSSHRLRLGCVVVCNDLSVAIAAKLVYLLFRKKEVRKRLSFLLLCYCSSCGQMYL